MSNTSKKSVNNSSNEKGGFNFGKARASMRSTLLLRKTTGNDQGSSSSPLLRLLKDLRPGKLSQVPARSNPVYHSEGKGARKRNKDRRRLSFHETEKGSADGVPPTTTDAPTTTEQTSMNGRSPPNIFTYLQQAAPQQPKASELSAPPNRCESTTSLPSNSSGLSSWGSTQDASRTGQSSWIPGWEQPPVPPVRDASSLNSLRYGPGHEKFPSWPVPAAADTPPAVRQCCHNTGGSHRSKSWTEQTDYPKESCPHYYTRPYMRRQVGSSATQGFTLKTVLERSEAALMFAEPPEMRRSRQLPTLDREGKTLGDLRYLAPSPPERDCPGQKAEPQVPNLTQVPHLTQAEVEEYARTYDAALLRQQSSEFLTAPMHQSQGSYAQSEGYHSYVSSTDSTNTPFLDRLRQENSECGATTCHWGEEEDSSVERDVPSSDILLRKWHCGSLSDMSVASSSLGGGASTAGMSARQLIAHSSRVQTPQRHMSESVLYLAPQQPVPHFPSTVQRNNALNCSSHAVHHTGINRSPPPHGSLSVAERVHELERQSLSVSTSSLAPPTRSRVADTVALKAFQKRALLSYYERQQQQQWRSEPHLSPPPAPPRTNASVEGWRRHEPQAAVPMTRDMSDKHVPAESDVLAIRKPEKAVPEVRHVREPSVVRRHSHSSNSSHSSSELPTSPTRKLMNGGSSPKLTETSSDLLGPLIVGPSISLDDWVPERPPKKPHLRSSSFQQRMKLVPGPMPVPRRSSTPDPPPPTPPPVLEDEVFNSDLPLPPPPPELTEDWCNDEGPGHAKSTTNLASAGSYLRRSNTLENMEGSYKRTPDVQPAIATTLPVITPTIATATKTTVNSVAVGVATQATKLLSKTSKLFDVIEISYHKDKVIDIECKSNKKSSPVNAVKPYVDLNCVATKLAAFEIKEAVPIQSNVLVSESQQPQHQQQEEESVDDCVDQIKEIDEKRPSRTSVASQATATLRPTEEAVTLSSESPPLSPTTTAGSLSPPASKPMNDAASQTEEEQTVIIVTPAVPSLTVEQQTVEQKPTSQLPALVIKEEVSVTPEVIVTPPTAVSPTPSQSRVALREEEECQQLSRDLASQLPPSDRLLTILAPVTEPKKVTDYVSGLFRLDLRSQRPASRLAQQAPDSPPSPASPTSLSPSITVTHDTSGNSAVNCNSTAVVTEPLPADSAYFTTSESKARFLTQYSEDISAPSNSLAEDLQRKKEELMTRLERKLTILREEQVVLTEETELNESLGVGLQERLKDAEKPQVAAKLLHHVEEVGKVTSLLLSLSGRLARAENAIMGLPGCDEKRILEGKRDKLAEQLAEATQLKSSIDRRSASVATLLSNTLDPEAAADFEHFVHMKASLQVESRELADRVRLGEEQLAALKETLRS